MWLRSKKKAEEQLATAEKGGIMGQIFNWLAVAFEAVVIVVAPYLASIMIVALIGTFASAGLESAIFVSGSNAPDSLRKISMIVLIVTSVVSAVAFIPKLLPTTSKCLLKALTKGPMKEIFSGFKKGFGLLGNSIKPASTKVAKLMEDMQSNVSKYAKGIRNKSPKVVKDIEDKALTKWEELAKKLNNKKETISTLAEIGADLTKSADAISSAVSEFQLGKIKAEMGRLAVQNDLFTMILSMYQQGRKQIQQEVKRQFELQGDSIESASQAIQQSGSLKGRIASSLA
jgi:predicted transcriptional regulator